MACPSQRAAETRILTRLLRPIAGAAAGGTARQLLASFGSLDRLLAQTRQRLRQAPCSNAVGCHIAAVGEALRLCLRAAALDGTRITGTKALAAYLRADMAYASREQVRVLFLSAGTQLIADEVLFEGSIDSTDLRPRPIIHRAFELNATGLILVHNHPSGDAQPSRADIGATRQLANACTLVEIILHDHLVVAQSGWASFRELGLL